MSLFYHFSLVQNNEKIDCEVMFLMYYHPNLNEKVSYTFTESPIPLCVSIFGIILGAVGKSLVFEQSFTETAKA